MDGNGSRVSSLGERLALPLTGLSAAGFAALSAVRRNRVFHPVGEAFVGTIEIWAPKALHLPNGSHRVLVRFSRGAGLPDPLPDVLGLAIKIPASARRAEQDFLLASSGRRAGARNLLIPTRSFFTCMYSSVLPYRHNGDHLIFGARASAALRARKGDFGDLERAADKGELRFDILASSLTGEWEEIARLSVGDHCDQEVSRSLRFNPWHTDARLRPAGVLNTMRRSAYPASQDARPS